MPAAHDWNEVLTALRSGNVEHRSGDLLVRALTLGHDVAPGTVGCSLTEVADGGYRTPAASTGLALELDEAQYAHDTGPCVDAARTQQPLRIDDMARESRFAGFVDAALQHGVHSSLSVPVVGISPATGLNLYSSSAAAFASDRAVAIAQLLSRVIAEASRPSTAPASSSDPVRTEARARRDGERVSAAVSRLMRDRGVGRADAFAILARRSRDEGTGILAVADDVLDAADGAR